MTYHDVIRVAVFDGRGSRSGPRSGGGKRSDTRALTHDDRSICRRLWSRESDCKAMKAARWHVLPAYEITHVTDHIAIFNNSDRDAHVEVMSSGELIVKPLDYGLLSISYLLPADE